MSTDPTDSAAASPDDAAEKQRRREIMEQIRQEFERDFDTTDPAVRQQKVDASMQQNPMLTSCESDCMAAYTACRNAGGSLDHCSAEYNLCITNCGG